MINTHEITNMVIHQLESFWPELDFDVIKKIVPDSIDDVILCFSFSANERLFSKSDVILNPYHSVSWAVFLYKLSRKLYLEGYTDEADAVYYLNKIMNSVEWFYMVDLPVHFCAEHPLGSVLGKAEYGDFFFVYQGTTVGGNRKGNIIFYPQMGSNILMYANSTILGDSKIGSNVIISAGSFLINENIPDNSIVFGHTPNLVIKQKTESDIKEMTSHIWKW